MTRVAAHDHERRRTGKIHQSVRPVTSPGVSRSHYRVVCGRHIVLGLPIEYGYRPSDLCLHCFPLKEATP